MEENQFESVNRSKKLPPLSQPSEKKPLSPSRQQNSSQKDGNDRSASIQERQYMLNKFYLDSWEKKMITSSPYVPQSSSVTKFIQPSKFSEKSTWLCRFCGGRTCKKERAECNPNPNPIEGLHCDWISDNILAMQRPNDLLIQKAQLVQQFKKNMIGGILNLQEPGEHPFCGPGLNDKSGFSYNPEEFQRKYQDGIYFFNYGWKDMDVTTCEHLIKIMSAFNLVFEKGLKIAVHCHAGTGRTGVAIVAWLIYGERMPALDAIKLFQSRRVSSLSKTAHQDLLKKYELFLNEYRKCFDISNNKALQIDHLIQRQNKVLFGAQKNQARYIPLILYVTISKLKDLVIAKRIEPEEVCACFYDLENRHYFSNQWSQVYEEELKNLKEKFNQHIFELGQVSDPRIFCQALLDYFDLIPSQAIKDQTVNQLRKKLDQNNNIEAVIQNQELSDYIDEYQFQILNVTASFGAFLQVQSKKNVQNLMTRFAISYLHKKRYMDKIFYKRSVFDFDIINMESVSSLSFCLMKMVNYFIQYQESVRLFSHIFFKQQSLLNKFLQQKSIIRNALESSLKSDKMSQIIPLNE